MDQLRVQLVEMDEKQEDMLRDHHNMLKTSNKIQRLEDKAHQQKSLDWYTQKFDVGECERERIRQENEEY